MHIFVRQAVEGDFETLWKIDQQCFEPDISYTRQELSLYMRRRGAFTLVAEVESVVAGFIVGERMARQPIGHVITLDVLAPYRRQSIASRLMFLAENRLAESQANVVCLETAVNNAAAIAFYKKLGYFILRTVPRYYNGVLDAFLMAKKLEARVVPEEERG